MDKRIHLVYDTQTNTQCFCGVSWKDRAGRPRYRVTNAQDATCVKCVSEFWRRVNNRENSLPSRRNFVRQNPSTPKKSKGNRHKNKVTVNSKPKQETGKQSSPFYIEEERPPQAKPRNLNPKAYLIKLPFGSSVQIVPWH